MRATLLSVFLNLMFLSLLAGPDDAARDIVRRWNELHNTKDIEGFKQLYADKVLFYGRNYTAAKCIESKRKFLASPFHQQIISPIVVKHYSSGSVKCEFTKRTKANKQTNEHASYLLLEKQNGRYVITGESDILTDENRSIQLDLGAEKTGWGREAFIFLLIGGAGIGGWYLWKRQQNNKEEKALAEQAVFQTYLTRQSEALQPDLNVEDSIRKVIQEELRAVKPEPPPDGKSKGDAFEKYIAGKFDRQTFRLIEWRSDKFHEGIYALSNQLPDMVWELNSPFAKKARFAVECKYRSYMLDDYIELAKDYQLVNYKDFEKKERMPVFVVLGLGGTASAPEELFIIPLSQLYNGSISAYNLKKFKKWKTGGTFFFDTRQNVLS
ncbi:MAG: hypothetical protein EOP48_06245 [Sphingobacteriales bacterium]|nr:MAG: hypothetical protein EOP48_06245 [Sphingobacteriales bacterium]